MAALAAGLFVFGLGEELWSRYVPEYLRALGASALAIGAFGTLRDLLDAAYAYPGGWLSDRLGNRRALLLFGGMTAAGLVVYAAWSSIAAVFVGLFLVAGWKSLGLPAPLSAARPKRLCFRGVHAGRADSTHAGRVVLRICEEADRLAPG